MIGRRPSILGGRANGMATAISDGGVLTPIDSISDHDPQWRSHSPGQYG